MNARDILHEVVVEQTMGNIPRLPHSVAAGIAEDVIAALTLRGVMLRPSQAGVRRTPRNGTTCAGSCKRVMFTPASTPKARLPEGAVHHHSHGYCGTCNSRRVRESRQNRTSK